MAHPDLDKVLSILLEFVQKFVATAGSFPPFGVALKANGEPSFVGANFYENSGIEMLDLVKKGLHECVTQPEVKAIGLCYDGALLSPGNAPEARVIRVQLEHCEGQAMQVDVSWAKG